MAGNAIYERKPFALPISLLYSEPVRILFCALSGSQCAAQYRILYLRNFVCWTSQGDELVSIATFTTTNSLCDESESNTRGSCTGRWESSRHCNTHTHIHIRLGFYLHSMYDALLATRCWANKMIGERNEKKTMCELRFSILFELVFVCDFSCGKHTRRDMLAARSSIQRYRWCVIFSVHRRSNSSNHFKNSVYKCSILRSGSSVNG